MDRRMFLRTALRELELILTDQPGLLGPKVNILKTHLTCFFQSQTILIFFFA